MRISDWSSDVCSSDLSAAVSAAGTAKLIPINAADTNNFCRDRLCPQPFWARIFLASSGFFTPLSKAFCAACLARSEEHTSELQSLMRISYAVFCLKKKRTNNYTTIIIQKHHQL